MRARLNGKTCTHILMACYARTIGLFNRHVRLACTQSQRAGCARIAVLTCMFGPTRMMVLRAWHLTRTPSAHAACTHPMHVRRDANAHPSARCAHGPHEDHRVPARPHRLRAPVGAARRQDGRLAPRRGGRSPHLDRHHRQRHPGRRLGGTPPVGAPPAVGDEARPPARAGRRARHLRRPRLLPARAPGDDQPRRGPPGSPRPPSTLSPRSCAGASTRSTSSGQGRPSGARRPSSGPGASTPRGAWRGRCSTAPPRFARRSSRRAGWTPASPRSTSPRSGADVPSKPLSLCPTPGCFERTPVGPCASCKPARRKETDTARGSAASRGYGHRHRTVFRPGVLQRDPICTWPAGCTRLSEIADHFLLSRRELVEQGLDPDDPAHGRRLCWSHHSQHTAQAQPGGGGTPVPDRSVSAR
ncbi:hypothetical protein CLV37_12416 [Kineococcus rhizosphaerae]|uniref:Uncharacterized protein n=1 Tax=Kineococcus rhizosphaerae TaxID=559628 RepID=A0A2T0QTN0_9ACTN|nr:hypothetical protein CLV37_12416 [Kineococcus rhizosphaerae]